MAEVADPGYGEVARQLLTLLLFSPDYSLSDVFGFMAGQQYSGTQLYGEWMAFDARRLGSSFSTPIVIIQGDNDVMTPTRLVKEWLEAIEAPHKRFVPISGGGHLVMATAPRAYLDALITNVLPFSR
jgi:pimeloyl-ACP methyl ester carboxylesterase